MAKRKKRVNVGKAVTTLQAIPDGKVVDFISGKLLNDTPEEYVRQNIAMSLVLEYGYQRPQIEVEFKVKLGSKTHRVDLAIFPEGKPHDQEHIWIIVETKKEGTKRGAKKDGVEQLKSYMAACIGCDYGMWTNGEDRACFLKSTNPPFLDAIDIPPQGAKKADAPNRDILRPATGANLLFAFRRCHNYIAGKEGLQKPEAFWELLKLIFCKIEDERSDEETLRFYVSQSERISMSLQARVKSRLSKLFQEFVLKKYPTIFKANEQLEMQPATLAYVASELQQYALLHSSVDVKGVAYEEVVGSNLRGDRGEFFTPRNACRMAVKMIDPQPGERVLDPACGTGGFLVTAMNHVIAQIEAKHRKRWRKGSPSETQRSELYRERHAYLSECVFGLDLNPNLVRAAKMNMVMNNDGSGNLFQANSLEHPHRWSEDVREGVPLGSIDVLFTNPPFGTNIKEDVPRVLQQYDVAAAWKREEDGTWTRREKASGEPVLQSSQPPEILFVERCLQLLRPGGRMAVVLPNGLLNNPGLDYFRAVILRQAQILAVVDMHRDLFQPRNDTQTSMVLLRKWADGESAESFGDYSMFMAIADRVGHDKRGNTLYKRENDGSLLMRETPVRRKPGDYGFVANPKATKAQEITRMEPIEDDELDDVAEAYLGWLEEMTTPRRKRGQQ